MANNAIVFVSNISRAHNFYLKASKYAQKVLYIKINDTKDHQLSIFSKQIVNIYSKTLPSHNLDIRLILNPWDSLKRISTHHSIDLILYDSELHKEVERLKKSITTMSKECRIQSIDISDKSLIINDQMVKTYDFVAVGGTFDRLHNGHKILLSEAALRANKHLTVGVTDVNMIQSKKLWELIEPVDVRIQSVLSFLRDIKSDLEYRVVPIQDMYGPTKDDPKFQMIVVSAETVRGAEKINEKRKENNLSILDVHIIELAQDTYPHRRDEEELKISSSNNRMRLLGTIIKPPVPNPNIPDWPYVIGLAGGIASGKSYVSEKLKEKGAGIINCDTIAHELYSPGTPLNSTIAEVFGKDIINDNGEVDRKKLGQIVFGDKAQLEKLNSIVWPSVIAEAQKRIQLLGNEGYKIVVMEAAVMVRAKWYVYCHQLWAVIVSPQEAIRRMQSRNNLTEEEAKQRLEAQPTNSEQIAYANVVLSPAQYDFTHAQVDRAWEHLQQYLSNRR